MSQSYVLSFANGITVDTPSFGDIVVQMPVTYREYTFKGLSPGLSQAIHVLSSTGATEDELVHLVEEADGTSSISRLYYFLSIFAERKTLSYGISCDGRPLATLAPTSASFSFLPIPVTPQAKYSLSRFAYLHVDGGVMVMESPLSHGKITLHGWEGAAVAAELARAQNLDSLCRLAPRIPRESVVLFLEMLSGARFLSELKSDDPYPGENEVLAQWDFHDLLFMQEAGWEGMPTHTEEPIAFSIKLSPCRWLSNLTQRKPSTCPARTSTRLSCRTIRSHWFWKKEGRSGNTGRAQLPKPSSESFSTGRQG